MRKVSTKMKTIDRQLGGGFPCPSLVLLLSESPTEKRTFAEQFMISGLREEETCVYVDFHRAPSLARTHFSRSGITRGDPLIIVDAVSSQAMIPSEEKYVIKDTLDMREIRSTIYKAFEEEPSRVIIDSLEFLVDRFPSQEVLEFWRFLGELSREKTAIILGLLTNWTMDERDINVMRDLSDIVMEFKTEKLGKTLLNLVKVTDGGRLDVNESLWIPYTFDESSGLVPYIPRILVIGSRCSGKENFVRALCSKRVVDDKGQVGEGMNREVIDVSNLEIEQLGKPGETSFDAAYKIFTREVNGVFLVIDSTDINDIRDGKQILMSNPNGTPLVIVANKQNYENAIAVEEIRRIMAVPKSVPIIEAFDQWDGDPYLALEMLLRVNGC